MVWQVNEDRYSEEDKQGSSASERGTSCVDREADSNRGVVGAMDEYTTQLERDRSANEVKEVLRVPLHGLPPPSQQLQKEHGQHRVIVTLKAQGYNNREIARLLGYSDFMVSNTLRQPWAREMLVELISAGGALNVIKLLQSECVPSILKLVEVRDDPDSRGSDVIAASKDLLDRFLGKPLQRVENTNLDASEPTSLEDAQRQLELARQEAERLKAN